ncbi:MAG: YitT family protein [Lachnospiraceae bacterium]|nr:YitT family protein [Lachnospiraceae bacterium]
MKRYLYNRPVWLDYVLIIVGSFIMAVGIQWIYDPVGLVTGGFTGLAIVIKEATSKFVQGGIPLWLANIVLNIPVFLVALKIKGRTFIGRTLFGTVMLSVWLYLIPSYDLAQGDYVLAAVFGGVLSGFGTGLIFLAKATTGGTDMVAALIQHYLRHYSIAKILLIVDGVVVVLGLYVFGLKAALYALVAIYAVTKVSDAIVEGFKYSRAAFIISDKYDEISKQIMEKLDRGVTGVKSIGMYSGMDRCMLYCVVSSKEIVQIKDIVAEIDPRAFVIVTDAREVLGEGFIDISNTQNA